ncbi:uncharacterized protein J4E88_005674 [Alternaria novae-zelandiae]|uniref:uncharacterized protein n=1 Tax=Alternaria novae-zelandiae TaxID=430562 RepID=UPI0020C4936A|nr:uncharacterized protein J4E88_005674 [Alternaria novae-zelandiae]KAI4681167.1 hypothetical protein J4E88_005674 [Alternaria novae-zelandiae]
MPLLAPTKGQKKAAKRAARKQGSSATKEAPSSNVKYALVGTVEPERFDTPPSRLIPTQDSATSPRDVAVSTHQHSSLMSSEDIDAASPTSTALQQLPPSSTDVTGFQSSGSLPTLSPLPLESLGSFNDSFTFTAPTGVATFGERSNITDVFNHEYGTSLPQDVEDIDDNSSTSVAFSEAFVKELGSPTFTTAAASSKAFKEVLSQKSDATESSIFTRLEDATIDNGAAPVYRYKLPSTAADIERKPELSSDCANHEWALVPYYRSRPLSLTVGYKMDQDLDENGTDLSLESILRGRMFLANADGVVQCIAYEQLLHDVETIKDDGGSDFESVASPIKGILEHSNGAHDKTSESIDTRIEDAQSDPGIRERLHDVDDTGSEGSEVSELCDRQELSSHTEGSNFGSDDAASVSTEKCEVVATQQGSLQSTMHSGSKEELRDGSLNELSNGELVETVSTSPQVPVASNCGSEVSVMRLGTEPLSSYLEFIEVEESGKATRKAVVTAFLKLVNIERKKRGVHALPSLYTAHSVLSSGVLPHTIKLGTTTVASFTAQLSFDEKDEVAMGDVCAAWDRLGREEVQQQPMASGGIMGALGRALGRLGGSSLEK